MKYIAEKNKSRGGGYGRSSIRDDKKFFDFILCFFRVQAILFTHIEIDEIEALFSQQRILLGEYLS